MSARSKNTLVGLLCCLLFLGLLGATFSTFAKASNGDPAMFMEGVNVGVFILTLAATGFVAFLGAVSLTGGGLFRDRKGPA